MRLSLSLSLSRPSFSRRTCSRRCSAHRWFAFQSYARRYRHVTPRAYIAGAVTLGHFVDCFKPVFTLGTCHRVRARRIAITSLWLQTLEIHTAFYYQQSKNSNQYIDWLFVAKFTLTVLSSLIALWTQFQNGVQHMTRLLYDLRLFETQSSRNSVTFSRPSRCSWSLFILW